MPKAYLIRGDRYVRYDVGDNHTDSGYPKRLAEGWAGIEAAGFAEAVDTALDLGTGPVYVFKGSNYVRVNQQSNAVEGSVRSISEAWGRGEGEDGFTTTGFHEGLDAAINWGNGKAYFFKGDTYIQYDIESDRVDDGPLPIAGNWPGMAELGFGDSLDAAINWGDGTAYFLKGDQYVGYTIGVGVDDVRYPLPIAGNWVGFSEVGFADNVDAAWVKLTTQGPQRPPQPPPQPGVVQPGDHVWYFNGQVSTARDIPRLQWFPDADPTKPTDYRERGKEIYYFAIHADGRILRGRPHMKNLEGSFAWLNNNPGNLTGKPGGADWGQYRDKFSWHQFLVFPSYEVGYAAINKFLLNGSYPANTRGPRQWPAGKYRDLGITEAFHRYAPESDGNNPEAYGADVAAAAGVPPTTLIRDLTPEQMRLMQDKIVQIEGTREGVTLARDSAELPGEVRALLG